MQEYDPLKNKNPEQSIDEQARQAEQSIDDLIRNMNETLAHADEVTRREPRQSEDRTPKQPQRSHGARSTSASKPTAKKPTEKRAAEKKTEPHSEIPMGKKVFIYIAGVLLVSLLLAFTAWQVLDDVCALTAPDEVVNVEITEGMSVHKIAKTLRENDVIRYPSLFKLYCGIANAGRRIVPGTYELNKTYDYHALVNSMSGSGKRATVTLMIPEGYTCEDIYALMEENGVCDAASLREAAKTTEFDFRFLEDVPPDAPNRLEGCLFPDTYEFYVDDDPVNVLKKLMQNTERKLTDELWEALDELNATLRTRKATAGFSQEEIAEGDLRMYDILIVASLIEKETAASTENGVIGSVIYNRLCSKAYPLLNIDASIQYALKERKEQLSDADKLIDSPYNTYKYTGLPVGPIANPGLLAIRGALFPEETNYYFYALGNEGRHVFTRSYDEHLAFLEGLKNA